MEDVFSVLNRIKWKETDKSKFKIYYQDRFKKELQEIAFSEIKSIDRFCVVFELDGREIELPLHRIRRIYKDESCYWKR